MLDQQQQQVQVVIVADWVPASMALIVDKQLTKK